ncbi:MAG TPA: hypothetical protein VG125_23925 [Pirellulales bacterium]|nr:hypothetical protein [Pirellulales bacterium]
MKRILRVVWRAARPLRRALAARFDQHLDRHFQNWVARVEQAQADQRHAAADMQLVADALVRELVRLQSQVQRLHETVELTLVDRNDAPELLPARRRVA